MWPILPFIAGIAVGASALGLARKSRVLPRARDAAYSAAQTAREKIRQATVSGLDNIQHSSGQWRDRLNSKTASANKTAKSAPAAQAKAAQGISTTTKPRARKASRNTQTPQVSSSKKVKS